MTYYTEGLLQENKRYKKFIEDFQLGVNLFKSGSNGQFTCSMKEIVPNQINEQKAILNKSLWDKKQLMPNRKNSFPFKENCFKKLNAKNRKGQHVLIDFGSPVVGSQNNRLSVKEKKG